MDSARKLASWKQRPAPRRATGRLLNLAQIKERFGIREWRIYLWVDRGQLHAVLIGRRWHYPEWELEELVKRLPPDPLDRDRVSASDRYREQKPAA